MALTSAALVGLAAVEAIPTKPGISALVPVARGNVALHLVSGVVLSLLAGRRVLLDRSSKRQDPLIAPAWRVDFDA